MKLSLLFLFFLVSACTIYSSTGRKDFETKSPDFVRSTAFVGCNNEEEASPSDLQKIEAASLYQSVRFSVAKFQTLKVQVWDKSARQVCDYQFQSEEDWKFVREFFIEHLP